MLTIKKAFHRLTPQEYNRALDLPVYIALLAAYAHDGRISEREKASAVRFAHLRTFRSAYDLRDYNFAVYRRFDRRFDDLNRLLPPDPEAREKHLKDQIRSIYGLLDKTDPEVARELHEQMDQFYKHVFKSERTFVQYFALPLVIKGLDDTLQSPDRE